MEQYSVWKCLICLFHRIWLQAFQRFVVKLGSLVKHTVKLYVSFFHHRHRIRLSSAFDPTQPCVALDQQKKKKGVRCKPSKVSVIVVEDIRRGIPKGKYRKELAESGRIVGLEIYRYMSSLQIKNAILRAFSHLPLHTFQYLVCCDKTTLILNADQNQDGNTIINTIQAVKGSLYILKCKESVEVSFIVIYTI